MHRPEDKLRIRAQTAEHIRRFFADRAVLEVMTPAITEHGVTDPHIESIALAGRANPHPAYLRTSPEYFHKRLLANGSGDIYELGPVFRGGEHGRHHRAEFSMLEWYRLGFGWRELADEVIELIQCLSPKPWQVEYRSWLSISQTDLGIDASQADLATLHAALGDRIQQAPLDHDHSELLDWWFATQIQPTFQAETLTVVFDYPAAQAALARLCPNRPGWAERFEIFAGPLELANGYGELTDAAELQKRFEGDNRRRLELGLPEMPLDPDFITAMESGLPDCAGVAMGFERLLMAINRRPTIDDVSLV
ncbi:MAG: EF-P lysine aminoacylase EpmA [Pseudomonadota bacterium]